MSGAGQVQEVTGVHKYYKFRSLDIIQDNRSLYITRIARQDSRKCDNHKSSSHVSGGRW